MRKEKNIGPLLVEDDGKLCGIVTERDVVKILGKTGCDLEGLRAADIMVKSENLFVAEADDQNDHVMAVMVAKNFRHMPIVDEGEIVGLISIRDVVRAHVKNSRPRSTICPNTSDSRGGSRLRGTRPSFIAHAVTVRG